MRNRDRLVSLAVLLALVLAQLTPLDAQPAAAQQPDSETMDSVFTLAAALAVSAGSRHTCGVPSEGAVMCWGLNDNGQVGDITTTTR